ncbi:MAG: RDD family protein [Runella sp.]
MSVVINTSQNVTLEYELASVGERIIANIFDWLLYFVWAIFWFWIFGVFKFSDANSVFIIIGCVVLPIMLYPLLTEYFLNGQTLGKRLVQIRVVKLDGSKPTLSAYLLRWLLIIVDSQLLTPLVAIVAVAASGKGQRIGDIAAGTTVVKTTKRVSLQQVLYQSLPSDYRVTYPEVRHLSDQDIETIRQVLRKGKGSLMKATAQKVSEVMQIGMPEEARTFLQTVVNDYVYLATQEAE